MKIVAFSRIKNAILTLPECLYSLSQLVDEIVVIDNGSTDGTLSLYSRFPKVVNVKKTAGFHEGRDKDLGHKLAKKRKPDWLIYMDADEVFESALTRKKLERLCSHTSADALGVRTFHFWLSKEYYRADDHYFHNYTNTPFARIFKNVPHIYFDRKLRIHTWFAKGYRNLQTIKYRLKHFGYIYPEQISSKISLYRSLKFPEDKNNYHSYEKTLHKIHLSKWHSANFWGGEIFLILENARWKFVGLKRRYQFWGGNAFFVKRKLLYQLHRIAYFFRKIVYSLHLLSFELGLNRYLHAKSPRKK